GNRLIYAYYPKIRAFLARRQKHPAKIKIEIALGTPVNTLEEANAIISRVFAANPAEIVASLPDYWRVYFQKQRETPSARESSFSSATGTKTGNSGPGEKGSGLARIGMKGVNRPQPIYTPAPEFSEFAKTAGIQGVCVLSGIIGVDGRAHDIHIVRPLGAGLDERAIDAVRTWKFKPATMNGQPVPIEMGFEIAFNLFK
ncbi:MAG: energy transducer TonB, partial [Actinomycetota bacterium]